MFVECYDEKTKEQLEKNGHKFLHSRLTNDGKTIWVFVNDPKNLNFSNIDNNKITKTKILLF